MAGGADDHVTFRPNFALLTKFRGSRLYPFWLWQAVIDREAVTHITTVGVEPIDHGNRP